MDNRDRVILLTSDKQRHMYVADEISKRLNLVAIVCESKPTTVGLDNQDLTEKDEKVLVKHFEDRDAAEQHYFGHVRNFPLNEKDILRLNRGEVNKDSTLNWIKKYNPDVLVLFGTAIIKDPMLSSFDNKILNMHLGLSPYYKGAGTNFWPLVNNEPECVGVTIHKAILKVDGGAILNQVRPLISVDDTIHDIGCKSIIDGTKAYIHSIEKFLENEIKIHKQENIGHIYRKRDFNAQVVIEMQNNFDSGMLKKYLRSFEERNLKFPITEIKEES